MHTKTDIEEIVSESVSRLRNLLFQLDPAGLESVGLGRALQTYMDHTFRDTGMIGSVQGSFTHEPANDLRIIIYRIAQEGLTNVRKHAQASRVTVGLAEDPSGYTVTIRDDGKGFDIADTGARNLPGDLGMRAMLDRAHLAGGWVQTDSAPGEGTSVVIWVPFPGSEIELTGLLLDA